MSNIYSSEPPTSGKVILVTNYGNIDIELWTKEAPRACRNFIQLCMENYFENNIFHRIIKGFMIQTGDPTGTGQGGESIWGNTFQDEFHSRLRFNHRGIVAMANKNKPHSNESQFFITLDKCSWLEKKHTIFGKVVGDTYYNVLTISELPTDKDDKPDFDNPPKILRCEVVINPFPDIFPRKKIIDGKDNKIIRKSKNDNKIKNYEDKNLLSFEESEEMISTVGRGIKAIHEMVKNDRKLVNKPVINKEHLENLKTYYNDKEENLKSIKDKVKNINENNSYPGINKIDVSADDSSSSSSSSCEKISNSKKEIINESNEYQKEDIDKMNILENEELFSENKIVINNLRKDILKIKKRKEDPDEELRLKEELKLYTPLQKYREKYLLLQKKHKMAGREETNEKLQKFKEKLKVSEGEEDNWMSNRLKFHVDSQRAYAINENIAKHNTNSGIDAIEIIDPKKRFQRTNDTNSKIQNPQILNIDKLFNVEDLINNSKQNKN